MCQFNIQLSADYRLQVTPTRILTPTQTSGRHGSYGRRPMTSCTPSCATLYYCSRAPGRAITLSPRASNGLSTGTRGVWPVCYPLHTARSSCMGHGRLSLRRTDTSNHALPLAMPYGGGFFPSMFGALGHKNSRDKRLSMSGRRRRQLMAVVHATISLLHYFFLFHCLAYLTRCLRELKEKAIYRGAMSVGH